MLVQSTYVCCSTAVTQEAYTLSLPLCCHHHNPLTRQSISSRASSFLAVAPQLSPSLSVGCLRGAGPHCRGSSLSSAASSSLRDGRHAPCISSIASVGLKGSSEQELHIISRNRGWAKLLVLIEAHHRNPRCRTENLEGVRKEFEWPRRLCRLKEGLATLTRPCSAPHISLPVTSSTQ